MMRLEDAVDVVQTFFDTCLKERDVEPAVACLTEDIRWIRANKPGMVTGRARAEEVLRMEFEQFPEPYKIVYGSMEGAKITDGSAVVIFAAAIYMEAVDICLLQFRGTVVCVEETDGSCRIASIHASKMDTQQEGREFFPAAHLNRSEMEHVLKNQALDILTKSIPGGMIGGYLEPDFPLYYINDRMLSHLGFTYDEFIAAIDGKVVNCMHPDDREQVEAVVAESFSVGTDYEVQYRMLKKGGSYIWVDDIGKKGRSVDGREVCISVIRDISAEVGARERLLEQAAEQKRLAERYDHLLQSVLCGIVQYVLVEDGVVFKNANKEAMRIFGYTPEEFWDRQVWSLAELVAPEDQEYMIGAASGLHGPGDKFSFEYCLRQKDGSPCWIIGSAEVLLDSDGSPFIQSVYMDISGQKEAERRSQRLTEQLEASGEILRRALENTATCEFYYYPDTGECVVPERTCQAYHCRPRYTDMPFDFAKDQVDEAYHADFFHMYERIHQGDRTAACEFRGIDGKFWCRETMSVIVNHEDGSPKLVIGIVENITRQKEVEIELYEARSRDSLTGLYNKERGIELAEEYLSGKAGGEHGVLMLLDMDDFKEVNQKEGNIFADVVLQEVADILRTETSPDDIQIRLGGDEFMLLIKNSDKAEATVIGPRIAAQVQNILVNGDSGLRVSVSIGMCSTEVVEEYHALYRCAESTLKYVKEHGKGQAACYLDTSNELGVFLNQLYTKEYTVNAIEQGTFRPEDDLVSFALDLLGKSKNLDDAVFLLLSRIGRTFGFGRVSIIEANKAYLTWRFSYQWARSRTMLQLGQDFYVSEEDFDICAAMYDEDGLADHNVRDGISDISSCLHAGIWNYGEYVGSMSFEINVVDYQWTQEQRKLLKELVKIIPSFIMKSKADAVSQAKTDFLSRMSHEIRTPMNAISGMTVIAKSVLGDREKTLDCLNKIESANTYLLSLINDILDMSRIESGKMELNYDAVDLGELLERLESLFKAQTAEKGLELRFINGYKGSRLLRADSLRLNQVLVNIIGNAVKFTDQGSVTVRVEELCDTPQAVLRFSVADEGIGIEEEALARIFNAFEQAEAGTAARCGGTGLGLSISSRLIQMMGAALEVRSEVGKGSEFYFTLALDYAQQQAPAETEPEPAAPSDFTGCRVLLAEDNELNSEIARTILEMNGFRVTCAADGQEALDLFCDGEAGQYDVILMDIRMPVMDGLESTRRIRTSGRPDARSIPIIALTANAFDEDTKKSMACGMDGHLSKPIVVEHMLALLGKFIPR